jgi:flagella basal body P-ring formation protein FlgA
VFSDFWNISANKRGIGRHFGATGLRLRFYSGDMKTSGLLLLFAVRLLGAGLLALLSPLACASSEAPALDAELSRQVRELALAGTQRAGDGVTRVDIEVGRLNPRLRLAPCQRVEPYLPRGTRLWGQARIGLRCTQGSALWNVYLPITVKIYARALVAVAPLVVGSVVSQADLVQAEVDLAEDASAAMTDATLVVGRTIARALNPGDSLREAHLKPRQWFAAGDTVKVVAVGSGFSVAGVGQALTPGKEGQPARVRTGSGRVLTGMPVADHLVQMAL